MLLMDETDLKLILMGVKYITLRRVRENNKGYLKVNSIQQLKLDLFGEYYMKVKILSREIIDLNEMDESDLTGVGYNKGEYLKKQYNKSNKSNLRVKYEFEVIDVNESKIRELFNGF